MNTEIKNLMFDRAHKIEIFSDDRRISNREADDTIRNFLFEEMGISKTSSPKQIRRALDSDKGKEFFAIVEQIVDEIIITGWQEDEFFNAFVETINTTDGDKNEFYTESDIILNVARVSKNNHDLSLQKLGEGTSFSVPTSTYGIKVGSDIRMFTTGRYDWNKFVEAIGRAFTQAIQEEVYGEFMNASKKLPLSAGFVGNGTLAAGSKESFDAIIQNVEAVNGSPAVIMGTKTALKKLNALAKIDWNDPAESVKEAVATTGILGSYEGTQLLEIPQRFKHNKPGEKMVDDTKLLIFPLVDYKPIKLVDGGESTLEITEIGDTKNDLQSYEVQRDLGVATVITRYFGEWNF